MLSSQRRFPWWPSHHTWLPFWVALLPCYGMGGMFLLSPVYFSPKMMQEWHVDAYQIAAPTSGLWVCFAIGALFWSSVADVYGRKPAAICAGWLTILMSAAAVLSWDFISFAILRAALGLAIGGQAACSYLLTVEWALQRDASLLTFLGNATFSASLVLFAFIAWASDRAALGWRAQQLIICAVPAMPLLLTPCLIESPRFVARKGRAVVRTPVATVDGEEAPVDAAAAASSSECDVPGPADTPGLAAPQPPTLMRGRQLGWLAIVCCVWFEVNLLFYGLDYAVGACDPAAGCDVYTNGALTAMADLPGYLAAFMLADQPRVGRRLTTVGSIFTSAACLLGMALAGGLLPHGTPAREPTLGALAFVGKCGAASAFQVAYILPAELFPPSVRGKVFGLANVFGRIACIVAPQAANVPQVTLDLVLGVTALGVGALACSLPETLGSASGGGGLAQADSAAAPAV